MAAIVACGAACTTIHPPLPAVQLAQPYKTSAVPGTYAEVDTQARLVENVIPAYPEKLHKNGIQGEVDAEFVVDTSGQIIPESIRILASSHELFTAAVLKALPHMMFYPAVLRGRKVRQLVVEPFVFNIH